MEMCWLYEHVCWLGDILRNGFSGSYIFFSLFIFRYQQENETSKHKMRE
jgi:hypothetical protein